MILAESLYGLPVRSLVVLDCPARYDILVLPLVPESYLVEIAHLGTALSFLVCAVP